MPPRPTMPPKSFARAAPQPSHQGTAFVRLAENANARQRALLALLRRGASAIEGERAVIRSRHGISRQDADDVRALHADGRLQQHGTTYRLAK